MLDYCYENCKIIFYIKIILYQESGNGGMAGLNPLQTMTDKR